MKHYDSQKMLRWDWDAAYRHDSLENETKTLTELLGTLRSQETAERAARIKKGRRAIILVLVLVVSIAAYKLVSVKHDLAYDLTAAFSIYMKR